MTISQQDAQKLLEQDIASHSTWKTLIDESTLSDSQKTALASFEYNL
jgi:GH24 family phage-related lysozyme (muramidase)